MKITDARAWLTARSSRVRTQGGEVVIGIPLDTAAAIAALLPAGDPPATVPATETPTVVEPTEPEKVVDTESGPVKVPQKKTAKKISKKRRKR